MSAQIKAARTRTNTPNHFLHSMYKVLAPKNPEQFFPYGKVYASSWEKKKGVNTPKKDEWFIFIDNGADTLAVGHLDYVKYHKAVMEEGILKCGQLDDRLGVWIILELLPAMGIQSDILLTTNEEKGLSTAGLFDLSVVGKQDHQYNWMYEFDRRGKEVVMYKYEDEATAQIAQRS